MRLRSSLLFALLLSLLGSQALLAQSAANKPTPKPVSPARNLLAEADQAYLKGNYKQALGLFREALRQKAVPASRRALTEYRMARCLGYMEVWDEAISESLRVASRYPNTIWEARSKSWLMRLYLKAPHEGWRVGERYYRGKDAPETDAATPPVSVDLTSEDWRKAALYGEQSKVLYEKLRDEVKGTPEEADMASDLARTIAGTQISRWAGTLQWKPPTDDSWKIDATASYDPTWPPPKKVLYLFQLAEQVGTNRQKPIARLAQAMWLRAYQSEMKVAARRREGDEWTEVPFPYQDRSAPELLRTLARDFPDHVEADQALLTVGDWFAEDGLYQEALAAYETLARARPDSRWGKAAQAAITAIRRVELALEPPAPQSPGKKATLKLTARNVSELKLTALPVKLEEMVRDTRVISRPREGFSELFARLGRPPGVRKFAAGEPVTWTETLDGKPHAPITRTIETPLTHNGAYLVEAEAGPVQSAVILVVSDLALIQLVDDQRITAMAVNADTGAPVSEASVVIRELYTLDKKQQISAITTATNEDGLAEKPFARNRDHSDDIRSFAWKGDRYAFTAGTAAARVTQSTHSAYVYTDRTVYRPGQQINFRGLVTELQQDATRAPLTQEAVSVRLLDPNGTPVETREVTTNEFGSVSGVFRLGSQPPLGSYELEVALGAGKEARRVGHAVLSVEEYRKPEFEIKVSPVGTVVRTGEPLKARIFANYYFGAPVPNAKVRWTVTRATWADKRGDLSETPLHQPAVRTYEGTGQTDRTGVLEIELDTRIEPGDDSRPVRHLDFSITAEVTDASRRTVSGGGFVRVPATQFRAEVSPERGFVSAGELLITRIRTADVQDRPVSAAGKIRVFRMTTAGRDERAEEVHSAPVRTDAEGNGFVNWVPSRAGRYQLKFEAVDDWDRSVVATATAWVAGDDAVSGLPHDSLARLIPESSTATSGTTARLLLVTRQPSLTLLVTRESAGRLLERRVRRLSSRSEVLELPLNREHTGELVVAVTGIHRRQFIHERAAIQVSSAEQLLTLTLTPDKPQYAPGERAVVRLLARDAAGRPVRAECSLGATDASLAGLALPAPPITEALSRSWSGPLFEGWEHRFRPLDGLSETFDSTITDQQPAVKVERASWRFPEGLGNIEEEVFQSLGWPFEPRLLRSAAAEDASVAVANAKQPNAVSIRSYFPDTAFWTPAVVTDANGEATVTFNWPDNITRWELLARAWSAKAQVGEARAEVTASKTLLVRLQSPRFFVERDELALSANVHNYTEASQHVRVALELEGDTVVPAAASVPGPPAPRALIVPRADRPGAGTVTFGPESTGEGPLREEVEVPAGGQQRVDWRVRVDRPGEVKVRVVAQSETDSDAVELRFPVRAHGVEKHVIKGGSLLMAAGEKPGTKSAKVSVTVPAERAPDAGELVIQVNPSVAMVMLDALPYLGDYPYGCTEQTLSRFVPAAISARVVQDLNLDLDDLRRRAASGAAPASVTRNPIYHTDALKQMVIAGLERLSRFQNTDGGWGWWENDASDRIITAYVVEGLVAGKNAGVPVPASMLDRGMAYLAGTFPKETGPHDKTYQGWVLTLDPKRAPKVAAALAASSFPGRQRLSPYGLALLALALKNGGKHAEARVCVQNLETTARIDKEAGTCYWRRDVGRAWDWHNNDVETAAACLRAMLAVDPKHRLAPMVVRWLANNRVGSAWSATRSTAHAVYALAEYVARQKELEPDYTLTVDVAGRHRKTFRVNTENALTFDNRLIIPSAALGSGAQEITITREGQGNVYFTAALRVFSLEEGIRGTGSDLRVRRRYFRLTRPAPGEKAETTKDGYVRTAIGSGDRLTSGDLVEVELLIESKNTYEHLVFEDMKPAGCEPVELRSGTRYAGDLCSNVELRDDRTAFFITRLPQGKRLLTYRLRAETPGEFHALPLQAHAMYAPTIRCISDEGNITIEDTANGQVATRRP